MSDLTGAGGLADLLQRTRAVIEAARAAGPPDEPAGPDGTALEGTGTALDGRVTAVAGPPGRLTRLDLDPAVLRLDAAQVAAAVTEAVNAAFDALRARAAAPVAAADLGALRGELDRLQVESVAQMARYGSALEAAIADIRHRRG